MNADNGGSSVPRRQLGRALRQLREAVPLTAVEAVRALEWSKPRLWRYETGQVPIHPNDVDTMCRVYGADSNVTEALKELARQSKAKGWFHDYADIPEWFQLFLGMESAASRLRQYEAEVIPGLLQSPGYARAIIGRGPVKGLPADSVERRSEMRMQRQRILTRKDPKAPQLDVILSESALLRGFTRDVMADQMACLLAFSERPNISIRVIPFSAGQHTGYLGPFVILDFPRETSARDPEPTTIFQESPTGGLYLDKPKEVETYSSIWDDLSTVALDRQASRAVIEEKAKEWSRA